MRIVSPSRPVGRRISTAIAVAAAISSSIFLLVGCASSTVGRLTVEQIVEGTRAALDEASTYRFTASVNVSVREPEEPVESEAWRITGETALPDRLSFKVLKLSTATTDAVNYVIVDGQVFQAADADSWIAVSQRPVGTPHPGLMPDMDHVELVDRDMEVGGRPVYYLAGYRSYNFEDAGAAVSGRRLFNVYIDHETLLVRAIIEHDDGRRVTQTEDGFYVQEWQTSVTAEYFGYGTLITVKRPDQ